MNINRESITRHQMQSEHRYGSREENSDADVFDERYNFVCDGLNEKGLGIGALYLPRFSQYPITSDIRAC
ncbi:linear amide C-N hydrolase [Vibrio quintilis]|uniref:Choloylglycine hydrolase/NAAA C-terminal domain-containing protein n=1 Tax=Vibrio quintilis TaxID=1117707 RepID=A0A1M7Z254_9VIBR|nr:linear amide C-N hydrolase [Vibrio quintilis]SHO58902.1 hypothetical protein VQ7734_04677 [Vibrio quintilis]